MNSQLEAIYDYMARNGKTLKPRKVCNLCKKSDVDFTGHNHVCVGCYPKYVKMTKDEKRKVRAKWGKVHYTVESYRKSSE